MSGTPLEASLAQLFALVHEPAMRRYEALVGYDKAWEALQNAMIEFYGKWSSLAPEQKTVASVMRAMDYRVRDVIEAARADTGVTLTEEVEEELVRTQEIDPPDVAIAYEGIELQRIVDAAVNTFPPQRRRAWVLMREGYSNRDIAGVLGITESTVGHSLEIARKHLRKALRRAGYEVSASTARAAIPRQTGEGTHA